MKLFPLKPLLLTVVFQLTGYLQAQVNYTDFVTSGEHDAYYKVAVRERQPVPLRMLREANVKYYKRVIRCIDPRQKMNKVLQWPRAPLSEVLFNAMLEGYITPYRNDSLMTRFTQSEMESRLSYEITTTVAGSEDDLESPGDTTFTVVQDHNCISKYWVMEEWIFDAEESILRPRILALAPVYKRQFQNISAPEQPLCWIAMDERLRTLLSHTEMFNRYNQAARLSMDDFFQMRIFDSYIIFESNVFDNFINQFQEFENDGEAALLESDRIKNDLFVFEHDLWQF